MILKGEAEPEVGVKLKTALDVNYFCLFFFFCFAHHSFPQIE